MRDDELAQRRAESYRGDVARRNTVEELIRLRESGYLVGPPAENTPRDWTAEESADIKRAYAEGRYVDEITKWFPAEALEVDERHSVDWRWVHGHNGD